MRKVLSCLLLAISLNLAACDTSIDPTPPVQNIAADSDFIALNARINSLLANRGQSLSKSAEATVYELMEDPYIRSIAGKLSARYPNITIANASDILADYRFSVYSASELSSGKENCPKQELCLGSVAAMGVIMMTGCSALTAGVGAIACGAGVMTWVSYESALCSYECSAA